MKSMLLLLSLVVVLIPQQESLANANERPNIVLAISDDQSFPHASAYGCKGVSTPSFDEIAAAGVLFHNAYAGSPGCSPSRASLLTGRYPWQLEQAGTHASSFPFKYAVYPELLKQAGYWVGYTGKPWGPGNFKASGRTENPAGPGFNSKTEKSPFSGISNKDYAGNFQEFLSKRPDDRPFCFWYGAHEPHRGFEDGSGLKSGKSLDDAEVPAFLPDHPVVQSDMLDYYREIEHFDLHLGRIIQILKDAGEFENTLIVVTSDNGMAFPRAKANCFEYGIHVPMAISWPSALEGNQQSEALVSFVDLAPTFLQAAGLNVHPQMAGISLIGHMQGDALERDAVYSSRERHSSSRYMNWTYPQRAMRSGDYLLIHNFKPDRWPAGDPVKLNADGSIGSPHGGYHDIDACPSLTFLIESRHDRKWRPYLNWSVEKRSEWQLFNVKDDPECMRELIKSPRVKRIRERMITDMNEFLKKTGDPRMHENGDVWESYIRYSRIRKFPTPPAQIPE
ncbi:MAG: sulfatase [Pirellulales bacterium]|nr:sulfatase [Pirellulales bacterium]